MSRPHGDGGEICKGDEACGLRMTQFEIKKIRTLTEPDKSCETGGRGYGHSGSAFFFFQ